MRRALHQALCGAIALTCWGAFDAPSALADGLKATGNDVGTVFFIGKSDDRNQVHYGIHLDASCKPVGSSPVFIYWQQVERGPDVTSDLSFLDRTVYGIRRQTVEIPGEGETARVSFSLEAATKRTVSFVVHKDGEKCVAEGRCLLNGVASRLERIYVKLASFWRVDYLDLFGTEDSTGKPIVERAHP